MTQAEHARLHHTGRPRPLKTLCKRGHPLSGENLKITSSGKRTCRQCFLWYGRLWKRAEVRDRGMKKPGPKPGTPGSARIAESNRRRAAQ